MKLVLMLAGWTALVLFVSMTLGASLAVLFGADRTAGVAYAIGQIGAVVWLVGAGPCSSTGTGRKADTNRRRNPRRIGEGLGAQAAAAEWRVGATGG
jgi:hypothetical protein